jgi:MFS family permease
MNRNFLLLWQGQLVSAVGTQAFAIATLFWLMQETDSATLLGLLMMASTLPAVLLGPLGGTVADRSSRRNIIVVSDLLNGLIVLSLALVVLYGTGSSRFAVSWLFVTAIAVGVVGSFFRPAVSAAIPDLVPTAKLAGANSLMQMSSQAAGLLGMAFGGVLFRFLGAGMLFVIDAITYLFSGVSEMFIRAPAPPPRPEVSRTEAIAQVWRDTAEGFRYAVARPGLRALFFAAGFLNFFLTPITVILPFYVADVLGRGAQWFGFLVAGVSAGTLLGTVLAGALRVTGTSRAAAVILALFGLAGSLAAVGLVHSPFLAFGLFVVIGTMAGFVNVKIVTVVQSTTEPSILGRLFGMLGTLTQALVPISMGLAGFLLEAIGGRVSAMLLAIGACALLCTLAVSGSRNFRDFLAFDRTPTSPTSAPGPPAPEAATVDP